MSLLKAVDFPDNIFFAILLHVREQRPEKDKIFSYELKLVNSLKDIFGDITCTVLYMSMATVMGPTPPGTGVRWLATSTTWRPECDIKDFCHLFERLGKGKKIGLIQAF